MGYILIFLVIYILTILCAWCFEHVWRDDKTYSKYHSFKDIPKFMFIPIINTCILLCVIIECVKIKFF